VHVYFASCMLSRVNGVILFSSIHACLSHIFRDAMVFSKPTVLSSRVSRSLAAGSSGLSHKCLT